MINAFSHFSLPQISTVARRTTLGALLVGAVALVGLGLLDYALVGLGICLGLAIALGNFRLIQAATVKATRSEREDKRRPLALNTLARMGAITVVALGLVFLSHELGLGVLLGLAVFQFMLLMNVVMAMLKDARTVPGDAEQAP
jgi:ATP synthase I chain